MDDEEEGLAIGGGAVVNVGEDAEGCALAEETAVAAAVPGGVDGDEAAAAATGAAVVADR
eukprot:5541216-Prorocentrum_lima.AAC.1